MACRLVTTERSSASSPGPLSKRLREGTSEPNEPGTTDLSGDHRLPVVWRSLERPGNSRPPREPVNGYRVGLRVPQLSGSTVTLWSLFGTSVIKLRYIHSASDGR